MKPSRLLLVALALARSPAAAPAPAHQAPPAKNDTSGWVFSILPKSFQKNPLLELTVITEMTPAGRQLPGVTPQAPAYVELFTSGPRHLGHAHGNEAKVKAEDIQRLLTRALATTGYLPAQPPAQPPSVLILYTWGAHFMLTEGDEENPVLSGNQIARNLLDRAALVGGEKFAARLLELFEQADALSLAASARTPPGGQPVMTAEMMDFANPVNLFKRASVKNEFLVDQAASDVYYVVASAYDYRSFQEKRRLLLWRTRMTVAAAGVSAEQSLPTLVQTAAPYFGKDMAESEILSRRVVREGKVEVGTPTVVEPKAPAPARKK